MNRFILGILLVLTFSFGWAGVGETKTILTKGCVTRIRFVSTISLTTGVLIHVGGKGFGLTKSVGYMKQGTVTYLTSSQLAAWENLLTQFRAAMAEKLRVSIWYDDSSKKVKTIDFNNSPCK